MFKIEMTFFVPDEKLKFEKHALLVDEKEPSNEFYSHGEFIGKEVLEGVTYNRFDPCPDIPAIIDGVKYNALTEKQQEAFCLVEGEYLFEYLDSNYHENTDEEPIGVLLARSCST